MAYKFQPPGSEIWYVAWRSASGRIKRKSTKTSNERAAENILSKVKVEIAEGRFLDKKVVSTMTLKTFGKKLYLPRMARAKPRSAKWRTDRWARILEVLGGTMTLDQANRLETIERYVDARLGKVSLATVKEDVAVFRHALRMAVRWKGETDLEEYRLYEWRPPENPGPPPAPEPVDPDVWERLLERARARAKRGAWGDVQGLAIMLLARTLGARRGEVLRLKRSDVDLGSGIVRRLVLKKRTLGETKETRISGEPLKILRSAAALHAHELIFANPETGKRRIDIAAFWNAVRKGVAGPRAKFHGLRHAYGRDFLADGHSLRELQDRLGHSSITTTEKYAHLVKRPTPPDGLPVRMISSAVSSDGPEKRRTRQRKADARSANSRGNAKVRRSLG